MRIFSFPRLLLLALCCPVFFSCNEKEDFITEPIADYMPLASGKYITYRLDSTVFTNFGRNTEVHSYQVKHVIDALITDNLGRPSYRVYRYIRDLAGTQPWNASGSYFITLLENQAEVIEDNLRFVKLHQPIRQDYNWPGNTYLPDNPYGSLYFFSNDDFMKTWEYTYKNLGGTFQYNQQTIGNVITVLHADDRVALDTIDVVSNRVTIPQNSTAVFLRGTGTDTIRITASAPSPGKENLTIYNQTNSPATLTGIVIPAGLGFNFEYASSRWFYPNTLTVSNNRVTIPRVAYSAFIVGTSTDSIKVNVSDIDTMKVKSINIYNKSNNNAYCQFNPALSIIAIPPGFGRSYELASGVWRLYNNNNVLLSRDPYIEGQAFGSNSYSIEKYAKNIGLVFKEFILSEFQPNTGGQGGPFTNGFGIKMQMIDHN